jgi:acyl-coenzyme A synthetase/AMP-(fatty) acid ligase
MDFINASFELCGGFFLLPSILSAWRAKKIVGYHWTTALFFWSWGLWNLVYYPHLGQWTSTVAGLGVTSAATVWLYLVIRYGRTETA